MPKVLILTGPGGSGKTTIAELLSKQYSYEYIDGDHEDTEFFPDGNQWLSENTNVLHRAHQKILKKAVELYDQGKDVVVDYIIFGRYEEFIQLFRDQFNEDCIVKVLMPNKETLIQRDQERECWTTGEERIEAVSREFESLRSYLGEENYINTTNQTPEETLSILQN